MSIRTRTDAQLWHDVEFSQFVLYDVDKRPVDPHWDKSHKRSRIRRLAMALIELDRRRDDI